MEKPNILQPKCSDISDIYDNQHIQTVKQYRNDISNRYYLNKSSGKEKVNGINFLLQETIKDINKNDANIDAYNIFLVNHLLYIYKCSLPILPINENIKSNLNDERVITPHLLEEAIKLARDFLSSKTAQDKYNENELKEILKILNTLEDKLYSRNKLGIPSKSLGKSTLDLLDLNKILPPPPSSIRKSSHKIQISEESSTGKTNTRRRPPPPSTPPPFDKETVQRLMSLHNKMRKGGTGRKLKNKKSYTKRRYKNKNNKHIKNVYSKK
jgi:hypothetical protein